MKDIGKVYRRRGRWWISFRFRGKEHRLAVSRLLGVSPVYVTEQDARRQLKQRVREIQEGRYQGPNHDRLTVAAVVTAHLEGFSLRGVRTATQLRHHAKGILEGLGHLRVRDLTTAVIQRYAQDRLGQGYQPATVNNELGVLRAALNRKRRHGELSQVPFVPSLPTDNVRRGFVEPEQFQAIVAHLSGVYLDVAEFAYLAARRLGEVVSLPWAWVDRDSQEIRWPRTKTGEPLTLPLSRELATILDRRWQARPVGEWLSPWVFHSGRRRRGHVSHTTVELHWKRAVTAAGFPGLVPHDLRRSGVRNMIRAGVHEHVAMAISGHRSEAIFRRYNIVSGRDQLEALGRVAAYLEQRTKPGQQAGRRAQAGAQSPKIATVPSARRSR